MIVILLGPSIVAALSISGACKVPVTTVPLKREVADAFETVRTSPDEPSTEIVLTSISGANPKSIVSAFCVTTISPSIFAVRVLAKSVSPVIPFNTSAPEPVLDTDVEIVCVLTVTLISPPDRDWETQTLLT